jgi:hypothetical protein
MKFFNKYGTYRLLTEAVDNTEKINDALEKAKKRIGKKHYRNASRSLVSVMNNLAGMIESGGIQKQQAKAVWDTVQELINQITGDMTGLSQTKKDAIGVEFQRMSKSRGVVEKFVAEEKPAPVTDAKDDKKDDKEDTQPETAAPEEKPKTEPTFKQIEGLAVLEDDKRRELLELALSIDSNGTNTASAKQKEAIQQVISEITGKPLTIDGKWGMKSEAVLKSLKAAFYANGEEMVKYGVDADKQLQANAGDKSKEYDGFARLPMLQAIVAYLGGNVEDIKNVAPEKTGAKGDAPAQAGNSNNTGGTSVGVSNSTSASAGSKHSSEYATFVDKNYTKGGKITDDFIDSLNTSADLTYLLDRIMAVEGNTKLQTFKTIALCLRKVMDADKSKLILDAPKGRIIRKSTIFATAVYGATDGLGTQDDYLNMFFKSIENNAAQYKAVKDEYWRIFKTMKEDMRERLLDDGTDDEVALNGEWNSFSEEWNRILFNKLDKQKS